MNVINSHELIQNDVNFINNKLGYHSIENIDETIAVTLHIYSPPGHITKYF